MWGKGALSLVSGIVTMEINVENSIKLKGNRPHDPDKPFLDLYTKDSISHCKDTCPAVFISLSS